MKIVSSFSICLLCLLLSACDLSILPVRGRGALKEEYRTIQDFEYIELKNNAIIYVSQGRLSDVYVQAQDNIMSLVDLSVRDRVLTIDFKGNVSHHDGVFLTFTVPMLRGITISGDGNIKADTRMQTDVMNIEISGNGSLTMDTLRAKNIVSILSASGRLILGGDDEVSNHRIEISGEGYVGSFKLPVNLVEVIMSGSGICETTVSDKGRLNVVITGTGNVFYKGAPDITHDISGTGKLIDAN